MNAVTPLRVDTATESPTPALRECVARAVRRYLADVGDYTDGSLYRMVMMEVERPMLAEVLRHCRGNQTRAAQVLGITRTTLRKKLAEAGLS